MAVRVEDVLQVNLIVVGVNLINTQEELDALRREVGVEIVTGEARLGAELVERTHDLNRDRIMIRSTPERTAIAREYPEESDLGRLAQVAGLAVENTDLTGQEMQALGYNVELVYESDTKEPALKYLAGHLFKSSLLRGDAEISGGAARLFYTKGGRTWQARLEPRFNDDATTKIFAALNLHQADADLSSLGEPSIRDSLKLLWDEIHSLIGQLEGRDM